MSRLVPFEPDEKCESCGVLGAFDFMGDLLCSKCAGNEPEYPEQSTCFPSCEAFDDATEREEIELTERVERLG